MKASLMRRAIAGGIVVVTVLATGVTGAAAATASRPTPERPAVVNPHFNANATWAETTGGLAHTWSDYTNAGGNQGPNIGSNQQVQISCAVQGFKVADGNTWWYLIASSPWSRSYYVSADPFYNNGATSGSLHGTPFVDPAIQLCGSGGGGTGLLETVGGVTHTFTDYSNAGGNQGPSVSTGQTVTIACRVQGFAVADGNTWWYQIASSPWNNVYYASADAFYNNGATSGSLIGTPYVDGAVPTCSSQQSQGITATPQATTYTETSGGVIHTWSDYTNAGGNQGPNIGSNQQVQISCAVQGFKVANGNTWWYQIASGPWGGNYYASADAFYNNGHTSGSLIGTPYVDTAVPTCVFESNGATSGGYSVTSHAGTETAGDGGATAFLDYQDQSGVGPRVAAHQTIGVSCRVTGAPVANGNTWYYLVQSSPWNNSYYVSADPFYNNGATSGSLHGTPFVDASVPMCTNPQVVPPAAYGSGAGSPGVPGCNRADPVNCSTGNFWDTQTDFQLVGFGPSLVLSRTYNSQLAATRGIFGNGWRSTLDLSLSLNHRDGSVTITMQDGSQVTAEPDGSGGFSFAGNPTATLILNSDGTYLYTPNRMLRYSFSATGTLLAETDLDGRSLHLSYNLAGQLTSATNASGRSITLTSNAQGLIATATDPLGRTTTYTYDGGGNLVTVTNPLGQAWNFTYDSAGQMLTLADPSGGTTINVYNGSGQVTQQTDPAGLVTTFSYKGDNYSAVGGTTTITNPFGAVEVQQYEGGLLYQDFKAFGTPEQTVKSSTYDALGRLLTSTDANGNVTTYAYDAAGDMIAKTDPLGHKTSWSYNQFGEVTSATDARGNTSTQTYDANGNLLTSTDRMGGVTTYAYGNPSLPGLPTSIIKPGGSTTTQSFNASGDLTQQSIQPTAGIVDVKQASYDADGERTCSVAGNAFAAGVRCDSATPSWVPGMSVATFDGAGRQTSVKNQTGGVTTYTYDTVGNRIRQVDPDGATSTWSYDHDGRVVVEVTGVGGSSPSTMNNSYDIRPGTGTCPSSTGVTFCTSTSNGNGAVTTNCYDSLGFQVATILPDGATTAYSYDGDGNRVKVVDAAGRATTSAYDADSRVVSVTYSDGTTPTVSYTYDAEGNRLTMSDGTGKTVYAYDANGRLVAETNGSGGAVQYSYDSFGNLTSITYPSGKQSTRTFDLEGRMLKVNDWLGNSTSFLYDHDGNVVQESLPNGDVERISYDSADRPLKISLTGGGGASLAQITYVRLPNGNIMRETDAGALAGGDTLYVYDGRGDLIAAGSPHQVVTKSAQNVFDAAGNLVQFGAESNSFNADSRLTTSANGTTSTALGYDGIGDVSSIAPASGLPTSYHYDQVGRLLSVTQPYPVPSISTVSPSTGPTGGGTAVTLIGTGLSSTTSVHFGSVAASSLIVVSNTEVVAISPAEVAGTVPVTVTSVGGTSSPSSTTQFTYVAGASRRGHLPTSGHRKQHDAATNVLALFVYNGDGLRMSESGATSAAFTWGHLGVQPEVLGDGTSNYVYGPGGVVLEQIPVAGGSPTYLASDAGGSTRVLLNQAGAVAGTYDYGVYGSVAIHHGPSATPLEYAQSYFDSSTGLNYLINRYYNASLQTFMSQDPAVSATNSPYAYANGNPINIVDPTGEWGWSNVVSFYSSHKDEISDALTIAGDIADLASKFTPAGWVTTAISITTVVISAGSALMACVGSWQSVGCAIAVGSLVLGALGLRVPSHAKSILENVGKWLNRLSFVHDLFLSSMGHAGETSGWSSGGSSGSGGGSPYSASSPPPAPASC